MGEDDNQALTAHAKKGKTKKEEHYHKKHRKFKDSPQFRCFTCDEKRHFARDCPKGKDHAKRGKNKRYHAAMPPKMMN